MEETLPIDDAAPQFRGLLPEALTQVRLELDAPQLDQLAEHYRLMLERNRVMNLTRIVAPHEAAVRHYADSLALFAWLRETHFAPATLLDVGTGAGFPAVPMAVTSPNLRVTAIDSTRKKIDFLESVVASLGLDNLTALHERAEHWQPEQRFSVVCGRAVAALPRLIEKLHHLIAPGGWLVAYKLATLDDAEWKEGRSAAAKHRLEPRDRFEYELELPAEHASEADAAEEGAADVPRETTESRRVRQALYLFQRR